MSSTKPRNRYLPVHPQLHQPPWIRQNHCKQSKQPQPKKPPHSKLSLFRLIKVNRELVQKKRVVFSEQLIIEGKPLQEFDLCNSSSASSSANSSTESLPNALNLEAPSYEEHLVQKSADRMQTESSPGSLVNNNNHKNSVNIVLSVCNDPPHAFNSDNSGISPSVPPPQSVIIETKPNLIEFKYDSSDDSSVTTLQNVHKEAEKEESKRRSQSLPILSNGPITLIAEDTISLPDVVQPSNIDKTAKPFNTVDKLNSEMKELVNQESRYSAKLEDAEKRASEAETKVYELRRRLDEVQRDVSLKECNIERLKAELDAACRECEGIRGRLRTQDAEIDALRLKSSNQEDELNLKYQNLEVEMLELTEKLKDTRQMANELNVQLVEAKAEAETLRKEKEKLQEERAEEQKIIKEALELALKERSQVEAKWKNDFEQLRTHHSDREEHLMEDCEWKLRSMQKNCKEKLEAVERERKAAVDRAARFEQENRNNMAETLRLRSFEGEVTKLRGLTNDQKETLTVMTRQIDRLRNELEDASNKLEAEIVKAQQLKTRCEYQICEKEREALNRIEIARGEIAMQWEDRLLHEMNRLRVEMEQTNLEDRLSAINRFKQEALQETEELTQKFNMREKQLKEEIESLKKTIQRQKQAMEDAQTEADTKLMQSRMFVDRRERELEEVLVRETTQRDQVIAEMKEQHEKEKRDMEQHFSLRIQQVQEEFERELSDATEMLKVSHKKELEKQWKQLVSEKEEALQLMESRQRTRLEEAENKIRELTIDHQRTLDLQEERLYEARSMETREAKNTQEIQTLHKKCRILTNLFEEMRMRYERREPRQEDLQQIEELKSVIESQDRDLRLLTERLREMQLQERELLQQQQQQQPPPQPPRRAKNRNKPSQQQQQQQQQMIVEDCEPQPIPVPIVCDVIYEENEAELIQEEQEGQQVVVDLPESVIQTETNQVHSTEPVIVQSEAPQQAEAAPAMPVIAIEQIPESTAQQVPTATTTVQAPTITITEEGGSAEPASEVDICEVTVELPVKQPTKNPPAEPINQQKVQNMPEMIVVRVPDVAVEAAAAEAIVSAPGPRSSST
uniref:Putative calponin similarity domain-containing protein n=1 Tax=Culex tarsalis TaxID=7177 RepID=A0A1Q3FL54_CULTA